MTEAEIDAEIDKNEEKYKNKLEEMKQTPQMNRFANVNTRNMTCAGSDITSFHFSF